MRDKPSEPVAVQGFASSHVVQNLVGDSVKSLGPPLRQSASFPFSIRVLGPKLAEPSSLLLMLLLLLFLWCWCWCWSWWGYFG